MNAEREKTHHLFIRTTLHRLMTHEGNLFKYQNAGYYINIAVLLTA